MKQRLAIFLCIILLCFSACSSNSAPVRQTTPSETTVIPIAQSPAQAGAPSEQAQQTDPVQIKITIGDQHFEAVLYDNASARAFSQLLPLSVPMQALHGNEFYYYFTQRLPTNAETPGHVNPGDLMLYGSDCLVLFYANAPTSYQYTPLGKLHNPEGLAEALGTEGTAAVLFEQIDTRKTK